MIVSTNEIDEIVIQRVALLKVPANFIWCSYSFKYHVMMINL